MLSPANCNFEGTNAALRAAKKKKIEINKTEKSAKRIGLVANSLPSINGGRLKSPASGGLKPSSAANCAAAKTCKTTPVRTVGYRRCGEFGATLLVLG
jgi:hypothetical protein